MGIVFIKMGKLEENITTLENLGGVSDNEWEDIKYFAVLYPIPITYEADGRLDKDFLRGFHFLMTVDVSLLMLCLG